MVGKQNVDVEVRRGHRYLSGLPVRDYRGDVELEPTEHGTTTANRER